MSDLRTAWRQGGTAALRSFRALPVPLRRRLVRSGTPNYTVGAVCVIEHDGRVLLLGQPHRSGWSLPGGLLDWGESPAEGVTREVREETGLRIDPGDPVATGVNPEDQSVDVIFRVVAAQRPQVRLAHEARSHRWMPLSGLQDADEATRRILQTLSRADDRAGAGRLLQQADGDGDPDP